MPNLKIIRCNSHKDNGWVMAMTSKLSKSCCWTVLPHLMHTMDDSKHPQESFRCFHLQKLGRVLLIWCSSSTALQRSPPPPSQNASSSL
uniref:Uncharacterized protein n=1 Tax=Arundo donax TaxID=35708 RepID=A0A0A9BQ52_ARUDO